MKRLPERILCLCLLIWNTISLAQTTAIDTVFGTNKTPIWDYVFLRNKTKEFLETAKGLEQNLVNFRVRLNEENEKELILRQAIEVAGLNKTIAQLGISYANQSKAIAEKNADIANLRKENKEAQIQEGVASFEFMKKKHEEIESSGFWSAMGGALLGGLEIIGGAALVVGSFGTASSAAGTLLSAGASKIVGGGILAGTTTYSAAEHESMISDQDAITERQTQDQIDQMIRERAELEMMSKVSLEQVKLEDISVQKAIANDDLAATEYNHALERLQNFRDHKPFPTEAIAAEIEKILDNYIQYSVVLAKLTEQAYRAEEVVASNIIQPYAAYTSGSTGKWLAADKILLDLNTIEFSRITQKKQKSNFSTYTLSLRNKDPRQIDLLRTRGLMNFDITQFELDLAFPGTYAQTIKDIEVNVIALADVGGIKGQLTKEGLSWKKVPEGIAGVYSINDWLKYVPSGYKAMVFADEPETMIFPRFRGASQTPGLLNIFEGKPLCGTYTLELPKYSNRFDYNTIFDVIITIHFASYFDPVLKSMVETEICEMQRAQEFVNSRILNVSMPITQPDDWYVFRNPMQQDTLWHKRRYLPFFIKHDYLPTNHLNPKLNQLTVSFLYKNRFANFKFSVTSMAMNPQSELIGKSGQIDPMHLDSLRQQLNWFNNFAPLIRKSSPGSLQNDTVFVHYADSLKLSQKKTNMPDSSNEAYELWIVKIEADSNKTLCLKDATGNSTGVFDESKLLEIQDVTMNFGYQFSYDFCQFSGRVYAYMDVDEDTTKVRGIDAQRHRVPYLFVREGGRYIKKTQERLAWYEWKPQIDSSFTLNRIIHKDEYAELVPFYSFLKTKTPIEEIEVKFDLKNSGDEAIIYCTPSWIAMKVKKVASDRLELRFLVDLAKREFREQEDVFLLKPQSVPLSRPSIPAVPRPGLTQVVPRQRLGQPLSNLSGTQRNPWANPEPLIPPGLGVIESAPYTFSGEPAHLIFRYLNLPGFKSLATVDITILEYGNARGNPKYSRLFNRPPVFYRWRNDNETNFSLRIHRDDYPRKNDKPNFILRDLTFSDFARF